MEKAMEIFNWAMSSWEPMVISLIMVLNGLIGFFLMIPGDSPEKQLQKVLDVVKKISKK